MPLLEPASKEPPEFDEIPESKLGKLVAVKSCDGAQLLASATT
jgi:hypothetical protein